MNSSEFRVQSSEFRFSAFASGVLRTAALAVALPLAALNAAGREFEFHLLFGAGHGFFSPEHRELYFNYVRAFLQQNRK